jgi:uncharacterized protein (DUF3084 family)
MSDTLIIQLREAINSAENMVPVMRSDMLDLMESAKCEIETLTDNLKQMKEERDEARKEICHTKKRRLITHLDYARKRGWNCFWVDYSKQQEATP